MKPNRKKSKDLIIMFVVAAMVVLLASLVPADTTSEENNQSGTSSDTETEAAELSFGTDHIRDNEALYATQSDTEVQVMYLTVSSGNSDEGTDHTWTEVNSYSVYDYEEMGVDRYKVEGLLQTGDESGVQPGDLGYGETAPNAIVQIRGQTSTQNAQKNYKISLKGNTSWNEQQTIALNKHMSEGLRFRNKMAYDLMRQIDEMMSLRTTFVHLYVKDNTEGGNGEFTDYGLYTQVEQLNKTALRAHGLNRNGQLYKINYFEFYRDADVIKLATDPTYDQEAFEELLEIKGDDDHTKLINMLTAVNDYTIPIEDVLNTYFDVENLSYWMAFHILTGNLDTQSRNMYIYSPLNKNTWYFYSWDNDGMMEITETEIKQDNEYGGWKKGVANYWGNVLFQRCLKSAAFREQLDKAVQDLHTGALSPTNIAKMTAKYVTVVKPYIFSEPDLTYMPVTEAQYDEIAAALPEDMNTYYERYEESLESPMPFFIGEPEITNGRLQMSWDASYSLQNEDLTYHAILAKDPLMEEVVATYDGEWTSFEEDAPEAGQYFLKVTSEDESGDSQYAFDTYSMKGSKAYGVMCFYIQEDGSVTKYESED